ADRRAHVYVIGKTGVGKSTLLETLMRHDLEAGHGFALLDPHGDLVEKILTQIPASRTDNLIYFNAVDTRNPLAFNPVQMCLWETAVGGLRHAERPQTYLG